MEEGSLVVRGLGAGARAWFRDAPWQVGDGTMLRDLMHVEDWSALEELKDSLNKAATTASTATWLAKLKLNVSICHFMASEYEAEDMEVQVQAGKGSSAQIRMLETVEYVQAKLQVASFPPRRSHKHKPDAAAVAALCPGTPASSCARSAAARAVLIFNLPDLWQRRNGEAGVAVQGASCATAGSSAGWHHVDDKADGERRHHLEDIVGATHEYMGVFKLNWPKSKGIQDIQAVAPGSAACLSGIVKMLCDPMALLDDADKATMQSFVASLASQGDSSSSHCFNAQRVCECIELHSGIASGNDGDSLALFYRLKLPNMLGGYESPWKPLYLYNLNAHTVPAHVLLMSCTRMCWRGLADARWCRQGRYGRQDGLLVYMRRAWP